MDSDTLLFRNMDLNEILSESANFFLKNFLLIAGIVVLANLPVLAWQALSLAQPDGWDIPFRYRSARDLATVAGLVKTFADGKWTGAQVASTLVSGFSMLLQTGALAFALSKRYRGCPATAIEALGSGIERLPSLAVGNGLVLIAIVISALLSSRLPGNDFDLIPFVALMLALYPRVLLVSQAIVSERLGGVAGLRRSIWLVKGHFWFVLLIWLVVELLLTLGTLIPTFVVGIASVSLPVSTLRVLNLLMTNIVAVVIDPFLSVVVVFVYFQLRRRQEGYPQRERAPATISKHSSSDA